MKLRNVKLIIVGFLLFGLVTVGCGNKPESVELNIAAAAGLSLAFTEVGKAFEKETGIKATFSFGSTGQLADQIENGAPFDIFAAADKSFIEQLDEKELIISNTKTIYALGRIGIATRVDNHSKIESMDELLNPEFVKVAIANPDHAPYGLAAKQALEAEGLWDAIESKLVFGRNIADTLTYLETGNAEVAFISLSLAKNDQVNFTLIDEKLHAPLEQMITVTKRTKHEKEAQDFINFISGPIGRPIMESFGYTVVSN